MSSQQINYLKQIVANLESIAQGKPVQPITVVPQTKDTTNNNQQQQQQISQQSTQVTPYAALTEFEAKIQEFQQIGQQFDSQELQEITRVIVEACNDMKRYLSFSFISSKPQQSQMMEVQKAIIGKLNTLNKYATNKDYKIHHKAIIEGVNGIFWVFNYQSPKLIIENAVESSEYHALKVKQQKIPEQTKWYVSFIDAIKSLKQYILQNYPTGLPHLPSGVADYGILVEAINNSTDIGSGSQPQQQPQPVLNQPPQQPQQEIAQPVQQQQVDQYPSIQTYLDLLQNFNQKAVEINKSQITEITKYALLVLKDQFQIILKNSYDLKKPNQSQIQEISQTIVENIKKIADFKNKPECKEHVSPILEGLNAVFWVLNDMPKMILDSAIESSEFHGNKLRIKKVQLETEWYNNFLNAIKFLQTYSKQNFPTGLNWNIANGSSDFSSLLQQLKNAGNDSNQQQSDIPQPPPIFVGGSGPGGPDGPPPIGSINLPKPTLLPVNESQQNSSEDRSALFSAINVGMDGIKQHLRKTNKQQLKEEIKNRQLPTEKKVESKPVVPKKTEAPKKEPKKYFKQQQGYYIENYVNEPLIEIEDDGTLQARHCLFIDSCDKVAIKLTTKINTIFVNKCNKLQLQFNSLVSSVQIVNSKSVTVWCMEKCPSIQIDKSEQIHISFMQDRNCEVLSTNTQEINLTYPQSEDEMAKDTPIPEQFLTKWDESQQKFVTTIFECDL